MCGQRKQAMRDHRHLPRSKSVRQFNRLSSRGDWFYPELVILTNWPGRRLCGASTVSICTKRTTAEKMASS